jgi:hypothetical protein
MRRTSALVLLLAACANDYDLQSDKAPNQGADDPEQPTEPDETPEDPMDSGSPEDTGGSDTTLPTDEKPIARCDVSPNPVQPPFESATWDGTASTDPAGHPIVDYAWALVSRPAGSTASMPTGTAATRGGFTPDLAGEYVGRLVVTTDDGRRSDPCEVVLESIPAEDLWVEMYWSVSQDDMDLHLLAPGGSLLSDLDCYYANCTWGGLDWGVRGNTGDNPSLDLDDIPGIGPENINIAAPQNGIYTVYVHDYTGSTPDHYGGNDVTVNIYLNGRLSWTDTRTISSDGDYVPFAEINWTTGTVSSL